MAFSKVLYAEFDRFHEPTNAPEHECLKAFRERDYEGARYLILTVRNPGKLFTSVPRASLLHLAAMNDWGELCDELIAKYNCDPLMGDLFDLTPLHYAAKYGALIAMRCLISKHDCNAEVKAPTAIHRTPLHFAVFYGQVEIVIYLLSEVKVNGNINDFYGNTLLHLAVAHRNPEVLKYLLSSGIMDTNVLTINDARKTPIDIALDVDWRLVTLFLNLERLDGVIKIEIASKALFFTCSTDCVDVIAELLSQENFSLSITNKQGKSLIQVCCEKGNWKTATYLFINHGCEPVGEDSLGYTLLHSLCKKSNIDVIEHLLSVTRANLNSKTRFGDTPLHVAISYENHEVVKHLLTYPQLDPTIQNHEGNTVLHKAVTCSDLEVLTCILSRKDVNVMSCNKIGNTPLHCVCNTDVLKVLINSGKVTTTCKNDNGDTALHTACDYNYCEVVKYLVNICNLDPTTKNKFGDTPLHRAKDGDVAKFLLSLPSIEPLCRNYEGDTPLRKACRVGFYDVIYELLYSGRMSASCIAESFRQVKMSSRDPDMSYHPHIIRLFQTYNEQIQLLQMYVPQLHIASHNSSEEVVDTFTYHSAFVCGETGSGKSSLVKLLSEPQKSFFKKRFNSTRHPSISYTTSVGILPTRCRVKGLGEVLFYEFAGHHEYHDSQAAVLGNLLQTSTPVFLIMVNITHDESVIEKQLYYWSTFVRNACTKLSRESLSKLRVILVGSRCDKIKSSYLYQKIQAVENIADKCLQGIKVKGCVPLKYSKEMVTKLSSCFEEQTKSKPLSFYCNLFYSFLVTKVKKIAVTVSDLTDMISADEIYSNLLYSNEFDTESLLKNLKERGLVYFQRNDSHFPSSWVAVNIETLPKAVCSKLFSASFRKEHQHLSNSTGVIPISTITKEFPDLDANTLVSMLTSLEFCHKIDQFTMQCIFTSLDIQSLQQRSKIKTTKDSQISAMEVSSQETRTHSIPHPSRDLISTPHVSTEPLLSHKDSKSCFGSPQVLSSSDDVFLFFPSLVNTEPPLEISITNGIGWCMWCPDQFQFLTTHFLHVLLLRLAYMFCLPPSYIGSIVRDDHICGLARRCSVWKNGIYWLDEDAIEVMVEVSELNRCVSLLVSYEQEAHVAHLKLRSTLIRTIISICQEICPSVEVRECLVSPNQLSKLRQCNLSQLTVYPLQDVAKACMLGKPYVIADITPIKSSNRGQTREDKIKTDTLLLGDPYQVITSQPSVSHLILSLFCEEIAEQQVPTLILSELKTIINFGSMFLFAPSQKVTYSSLKDHLNEFSILARPRTSPMILAGLTHKDMRQALPICNAKSSPINIYKRHMSEMLGMITDSDTERLLNDLSCVDLIPYSVKDNVLTTKSLSRYERASMLLNEAERPLRESNTPEILEKFCEVLKKQSNSALTRIAENILKELGIKTGVTEKYASYLRAMYGRRLDQYSQWSPIQLSDYIPMMFSIIPPDVLNTDEFLALKARNILSGKVSSTFNSSERFTLDVILGHSYIQKSKSILIEGAPGIGKTAFTYTVCRMWAKKQALSEFSILVRWNLSDLFSSNFENITDIFMHDNEAFRDSVANEVTSNGGKNVLLVFDGWDEIPVTADKTRVQLLIDLIKGKRLPEASVIVTTRSLQAGKEFKINRSFFGQCVEVIGFSEENIEEYIKTVFSRVPSKAEELIQQLSLRHDVKSMCYIPINCGIVTYVFSTYKSQTLPKTLTEFYDIFTRNCLLRNLQLRFEGGDDIPELPSLSVLPIQVSRLLSVLSELAFRGLWVNKHTYSRTDIQSLIELLPSAELEADRLGILQSQQVYHSGGYSIVFHFLHSSVQQFLAAHYISTLSVNEQAKYVKTYFQYRPFSQVWMHLSWLLPYLALNHNGFVHTLCDLASDIQYYEEPYRDHFSLEDSLHSDHYLESDSDEDCFEHDSGPISVKESLKMGQSQALSIGFCGDEFEEKTDTKLSPLMGELSTAISNVDSTVSPEAKPNLQTLSDSSLFAKQQNSVSTSLCGVSLELNMPSADQVGSISQYDDKITRLMFALKCIYESQNPGLCSTFAGYLDGLLYLQGYQINQMDIVIVAYFLVNANAPFHLQMSSSNIQSHHLLALHKQTEEKHASPIIQALSLRGNDLDPSCAHVLSRMTRALKFCEKLFLGHNEFRDEGVKILGKMLSELAYLKQIDLANNDITSGGCNLLLQSLNMSKHITHVRLSNNPLGFEVVHDIVLLLQKQSITHLELDGIQLGDKGVEKLAAHLGEINCFLKHLNISSNNITEEGAVCLATALNVNQTLECLKMNSNPIGTEAASFIFSAISGNSSLVYIDVSDCNIYKNELLILSLHDSFLGNNTLKKVDISYNFITDEGLALLIQSLITACDHSELSHLVLTGTGVGKKTLEALAKALLEVPKLSALTLSGTEFLNVYLSNKTIFDFFIDSLANVSRPIILKFIIEDGYKEKQELLNHMQLLKYHRKKYLLPKVKVCYCDADKHASPSQGSNSEFEESYETIEEIVISEDSENSV